MMTVNMISTISRCLLAGLCLFLSSQLSAESVYQIGAAKTDITGPFVASSTGYNSPGDEMSGLAMRLYSRAFVIEQEQENIIAIVTVDQLHMYQSVKLGVVKALAEAGLADVFTERNVLLSATHTHAATSNISWYTLFNLFNGVTGFDELHYAVVVRGITESIISAYQNRQPGIIKYGAGEVSAAAFNRSSIAYDKNIDQQRFLANTEKTMQLLRFDATDGTPIGLINWFAVHGTSLGITNRHIHGDNKGWAAYRFEKEQGGDFVAAFAQGAMGDVSPNKPNPEDITKPFLRPSDLNSKLNAIENPIVAGDKQFTAALAIYKQAAQSVALALDFRHTYVDFNQVAVENQYIKGFQMPWDADAAQGIAQTCVGVIGAGFLAGDEEGAPVALASEGQIKHAYMQQDGEWSQVKYDLDSLDASTLADALGALWPLAEIALQTEKYDACHKEKFSLLPVGEVDDFWLPNPNIPFVPVNIPLQVIRLGQIAILATPFEITTMAGRRLKQSVSETLAKEGIDTVIVAGMANSYGQYLTTREEYAAQHFEGAFNIYGPWAMATVAQELDRLSQDLVNGSISVPGPTPPDLSSEQIIETWISSNGVVTDGGEFGEILTDVNASYNAHSANVEVVFRGAHPRTVLVKKMDNTLKDFYSPADYSFLEIQKYSNGSWATVAKDDDPYTTFSWAREGGASSLSDLSTSTVSWLVRNQQPGQYRIKYNGLAKRWWLLGSTYQAFTGVSSVFELN